VISNFNNNRTKIDKNIKKIALNGYFYMYQYLNTGINLLSGL